ncbi:MAG: FCD domain-containing protein [Rhodopila sp.]|nr:FCD domain-containing protein [Rhodopila sp.]
MHKTNFMHKTALPHQPDSAPALVVQAVSQLRDAIMWVKFPPGAKLKVAELQDKLGLSSSPLREALSRLVSEGLVEAEERRGFRVAEVTVDEFEDVARMRILLEQEAVGLAIRRGDDAWEAEIVGAFHRLAVVEERLPDIAPSLDRDWSERHRVFHMALLAACGSPHLLRLCGDFFQRAERFRRISARFREQPRRKSDEHAEIMRAVLARDTKAASRLLERHIRQTADNVAAVLVASRAASIAAAGRKR